MTVVRYKNKANSEAAFNNFISDLFPQTPSLFRDEFRQTVPVNIRETEEAYLLDVVAPGWMKEDFKIQLDNNLLTLSVERKEEEAANEKEKFVRREYRQQGFKRSFTVDEKVNTDAISAQYVNGVLTLNLPKKAEVKPATKQISVQ